MTEPTQEEVQKIIREEGKFVTDLLIDKNNAYGNSAVCPKRFFSRADGVEQIKVRIDDKLNRLVNGLGDAEEEDVVLDLIGYLILLRVAQRVQTKDHKAEVKLMFDAVVPNASQEDYMCSCKTVNMGFLHLRGPGCDL